MAMKQRTGSTFWKPTEKGESIEGRFLGTKQVDGFEEGSTQEIAAFVRDDGSTFYVGGVVVLGAVKAERGDGKPSKDEPVKVGELCRMTYNGEKSNGKQGKAARSYKLIAFESDPDDIEPADIPF